MVGSPYLRLAVRRHEEATMRTPLTERFDLTVPVVGAGGGATPGWIAEQGRVAAASGRAWGVGLLAWVLAANPAQLDAVVDLAPPLVSVSFGPYERHVARLKQAGSAVATQVGTLAE